MLFQDSADFVAEIAFYFEDEASRPAFSIFSTIGEHLFGKGVHACTGLTASHGSEDGDPGKQTPLGHDEPLWSCGGLWTLGMVQLADYQIEFAPHCWRNIRSESPGCRSLFSPHCKDVEK